MSLAPHRFRTLAVLVTALATLVAATACQQREQQAEDREMEWARAALERNPAIEVVAADPEARRFTVRMRDTGELATVALGTIMAGPPGSFAQAKGHEPDSQPAGQETVEQDAATEARPDAGGEGATQAAGAEGPASQTPAGTSSDAAVEAPAYSVERSADGVRITGPGVSIETVGPAPAAEPGIMRADSPIICEGPRLLKLDGRTLAVSGDAIVARGGCEIHLTNSRVDASRAAIVVRDARVHITNCELRGLSRSLDIYDGGEVYARSSEFSGLVQQHGSGRLEDLGDNRFR
jgi:hypothetical protein